MVTLKDTLQKIGYGNGHGYFSFCVTILSEDTPLKIGYGNKSVLPLNISKFQKLEDTPPKIGYGNMFPIFRIRKCFIVGRYTPENRVWQLHTQKYWFSFCMLEDTPLKKGYDNTNSIFLSSSILKLEDTPLKIR